MALETVVYLQDPLSYSSCKDFPFHDLYFQQGEDQDPLDTKNNIKLGQEQRQGFGSINYNGKGGDNSVDYSYNDQVDLQWPLHELPYGSTVDTKNHPPPSDMAATGGERRKRRRTRSNKNKEEIENQRMTHIAGDQASIVGGAINYLKELEHQLQSMEPQVKTTATKETGSTVGDKNNTITASSSGPFSDFFAFPQYSSRPSSSSVAEGTAEIEVTMVESHASVKILAKKRPKQLLKLVGSIQSLRLTLLHLNVTTHDDSVLYSISLK
ncbi:hypothetical protein IGI04_028706, partial [Brassica rapa subsp. trilocularis]